MKTSDILLLSNCACWPKRRIFVGQDRVIALISSILAVGIIATGLVATAVRRCGLDPFRVGCGYSNRLAARLVEIASNPAAQGANPLLPPPSKDREAKSPWPALGRHRVCWPLHFPASIGAARRVGGLDSPLLFSL